MMDESTMATDRLVLRPLAVDDADDMVAVLGDQALYEFTGGAPPTAAELRRRYERQVVGHSGDGVEEWHNWVVRRGHDDVAVGYVQSTITGGGRLADVAWVTGVEFQGNGYAVEAATAMVDWLFGDRGVGRVVAHVHPDHEASNRVAARVGLRPTDGLDDDGERLWELGPVERDSCRAE